MNSFPFKRIVIIGTTSSGKSTLAKRLASLIHADFVELDALHWEPNWVEADLYDFRERADIATDSPAWVLAGNYHVVRDIIWPKAELIIWLDYPFPIVFWRLLTRTISRAVTQEELWNGNRESFWPHMKLWSKDSLFHWLFITYWRRKREYPEFFSWPENAHLKVIHFKHPKEAEEWIGKLTVSPTAPPTSPIQTK
ncbi:MAG: adenylate kinase [Chloroflexi bacterium]|nr:adenylate kinase [Chloroflexota bacterium]